MKIQCDVCNENEALVYCSADEAALCLCVHHANTLAGNHPRFSLLHPQPKDSPVCDICQEKKALLFCQQDRAIMCKDCDLAIHKVNDLTRNHNRFLLTGVKLSPTASLYSSSNDTRNDVVSGQQHKPLPSPIIEKVTVETPNGHHDPATSSISECLIETLPGWHVEDFLDDTTNFSKENGLDILAKFEFKWFLRNLLEQIQGNLLERIQGNPLLETAESRLRKLQVVDDALGMIWGGDLLEGSLNTSFSPESMNIWVPQAPPPAPPSRYAHVSQPSEPRSNMGFGEQTINGSTLSFAQNDYNNLNKITKGTKSSRKWTVDNGNCFMVPQINSSSTTSKRSRTLWH